jgi:hypothetical protein
MLDLVAILLGVGIVGWLLGAAVLFVYAVRTAEQDPNDEG